MRGVPLLAFTKTCANGKALLLWSTLRQVFDRCPLSNRPTAAHLAAFILPSLRSITFAASSLGHGCDILRTAAMDVHANHCGPPPDDVGTNRRSIGALAVD